MTAFSEKTFYAFLLNWFSFSRFNSRVKAQSRACFTLADKRPLRSFGYFVSRIPLLKYCQHGRGAELGLIGSLSTRVFETWKATGRELFSLLSCFTDLKKKTTKKTTLSWKRQNNFVVLWEKPSTTRARGKVRRKVQRKPRRKTNIKKTRWLTIRLLSDLSGRMSQWKQFVIYLRKKYQPKALLS